MLRKLIIIFLCTLLNSRKTQYNKRLKNFLLENIFSIEDVLINGRLACTKGQGKTYVCMYLSRDICTNVSAACHK